jgi:hypothetical protein
MPVQAIITQAGRRIFRDARGRFISKAKYELERRRGPGGRFLTRAGASRQQGIENFLRAQLGAPPAGKTWYQIASKYPDRFSDYLEELNA